MPTVLVYFVYNKWHRKRKKELMEYMVEYIQEFYPGDIFENADYSRIVNEEHFDRLLKFLDDGHIVHGGG